MMGHLKKIYRFSNTNERKYLVCPYLIEIICCSSARKAMFIVFMHENWLASWKNRFSRRAVKHQPIAAYHTQRTETQHQFRSKLSAPIRQQHPFFWIVDNSVQKSHWPWPSQLKLYWDKISTLCNTVDNVQVIHGSSVEWSMQHVI